MKAGSAQTAEQDYPVAQNAMPSSRLAFSRPAGSAEQSTSQADPRVGASKTPFLKNRINKSKG